jgi:thioredoxin 1
MVASTTAGLRTVTDETFEQEVLRAGGPVLVEFWAQWCGPCHMIKPILAEIAAERAGRLDVFLLNSDENPATSRDYQVMSLPTLLLFRDGRPVRSIIGAQPKARLLATLDAALTD